MGRRKDLPQVFDEGKQVVLVVKCGALEASV
jgi:hypothetical protein